MYYYYADHNNMIVYVHKEKQLNTNHRFLGSTDNPKHKMAVSAFLPNKSGYSIVFPSSVSR